MNSIMNMLGNGNNNIMLQAMGAMMRGESPRQFLSSLAQNNPQLQGLNLDNLQQTAEKVCKDNNVDMNSKMKEIKSSFFNR